MMEFQFFKILSVLRAPVLRPSLFSFIQAISAWSVSGLMTLCIMRGTRAGADASLVSVAAGGTTCPIVSRYLTKEQSRAGRHGPTDAAAAHNRYGIDSSYDMM